MKKVIAGLAAASVVGVAVPGMDSAHAQVPVDALKETNGQTQTQTTVTETKKVETTSELKYTVTADVLNVRSGAGTGHNVISKVKSGQVLQVIGQENGWFKVSVNGQTGYVSGDFVTTGGNKGTTVQQGTGTYTVNVSSLNVRTGPSASHTVLGSVNKGKTVQVVGEVQDWFKINFNGGTGYVSKDFVTKGGSAVSNQTQQPTTNNNNTTTVQTGGSYVVNTGALKVRTGPATYNPVIGGVTNGTVLNVTGAENGWYKINHNGRTGYVSADFVKFVKGGVNNVTNNVQQPTTGGDTSSIVGFAKSLNHSDYVFGGETPDGFDCSGFIHYVLNKTGHEGKRQTVAGYWSSKTKTSNPQPGDLIYFSNTYKKGLSHMGVYLGNGQFISAENEKDGVRISSIKTSYWAERLTGYTKAY